MKVCILLLTVFSLVSCHKGIDNKEAVRQAMMDYLTTRTNLNVSAMKVEVTSVTFKQNEADAVVSFSPKDSNPAVQGMSMRYTLEKKGDQWVVKGRADAGKNPHGSMGANPHMETMPMPGMPGGSGNSMQGTMPPGHPPMGGGTTGGKTKK